MSVLPPLARRQLSRRRRLWRGLRTATPPLILAALWCAGAPAPAEALPVEQLGAGVVESLAEVERRERENPPPRADATPHWRVFHCRGSCPAASGRQVAVNALGARELGIRFRGPVLLQGAYFAAQGGPRSHATAVQFIGYRDGTEVGRSSKLSPLLATPQWLAAELPPIDRVVIHADGPALTHAWYALDDLTFSPLHDIAGGVSSGPRVVTFDDLPHKTELTNTGYHGLVWETGESSIAPDGLASFTPPAPAESFADIEAALFEPLNEPMMGGFSAARQTAADGGGTAPDLAGQFPGLRLFDVSTSIVPDSMGAVGPNHFIQPINSGFAIFNKEGTQRLSATRLDSFFGVRIGDPRAVFDQHSGRYIIIASDFSTRIYFAISLTDNPLGPWYKNSFVASSGPDAGNFPDYPTLGVDARAIYVAATMYPRLAPALFVIDKAPLLTTPPAPLPTVSAFRNYGFSFVSQLAHVYGDPGAGYFVELTGLFAYISRIDPPASNPTRVPLGRIPITRYQLPFAAQARDSDGVWLIDDRAMMAVYRNGSLWTCRHVQINPFPNQQIGIAWYEFDVATMTLRQSGLLLDPARQYYYPSLMVNDEGDVVMAFSGSSPSEYIGAWITGRRATDPPGEMAPPRQLQPGAAPYTRLDPSGLNRWGDYSYTTLDPSDQCSFYTVQEYVHANNVWGTVIGRAVYPNACRRPGDLNCDRQIDFGDLDGFTTALLGRATYRAAFPDCRWLNADVDADGAVTFGDIDGFIACLIDPGVCR